MDIVFIICIITAFILFYIPFFGQEKDFWACLDAFLTNNRRRSWFNDYPKKDEVKEVKMGIFLLAVLVTGVLAHSIIHPFSR